MRQGFPATIATLARLGALALTFPFFPSSVIAEPPLKTPPPPTFSKDVAPILREKCQSCHRKGQIAPFGLETFEQARKRSADIAEVVRERRMPPWKPAVGVGPKFLHDRSLSDAEIQTLRAWTEGGSLEGDPKQAPAPVIVADGWALGTPDLILEPAEDFAIPAEGRDTYRCFVIPTNLTRDVYVSAIEYRPGNTRVVHHMSAFLDTRGCGRILDEAEPGPGYTMFAGPGFDPAGQLGFWAAGNVPSHLPEGIGQAIPRRSDLILQIHYHPDGKPETDRTRVGFYFSKTPVKQVLHWNDASAYGFKIPAGDSNFEVKGSWYIPVDVEALAVAPHMHQLGSDIRMIATPSKGKPIELIHIPDWDPAWQGTYFFEKPISLVRGTTINVVGHFDNSARPRNPSDPPKNVRWGHGVHDEMCVGYIAVVKKGQDLTKPGASDDLFQTFQKQRLNNVRKQISKQNR